MKKTLVIALALMMILTLFCACRETEQEPTSLETEQEIACRVLCITEDGFIAWTAKWGNVYIKYGDPDLRIAALATAYVKFSEEDLKPATGTFTTAFGEQENYQYMLESPKGVRLPGPGEPTYG